MADTVLRNLRLLMLEIEARDREHAERAAEVR
jgi:hypothetical protein